MTTLRGNGGFSSSLAALGERDGGFEGLGVAEHGDVHDVADLAAAQRVGEVVEIADGLAGEIDEHVAGFQAGLCGGRAGLDIAEAHAVFRLPKIRNRAEPRAIAATTARAGDAAVGIFGGDGDEFGTRGWRGPDFEIAVACSSRACRANVYCWSRESQTC